MLSLLQPAEDVGIYTVAFRIYDMTILMSGLFMATVFPLLAAYLHRRDPLARAAIERAFNFMTLVFVPAAAMLFVYAERLVVFVSNQDFAAAATPLRILSFAVPFSAAGSVFALALIALNEQKKLLALTVAAVIISVSINAYLVPRYSYRAAAATTVFSECLGCVAAFAIARRRYRFRLQLSFIGRVLLACGVMVVTILVLRHRVHWVAPVLGTLTYIATAYVTKVITRRDIDVVFGRSVG